MGLTIEPLLRQWRMKPIMPYVKTGGVLVDVGCDDPALTINTFKASMSSCIGLDADVTARTYENVTIKKVFLDKTIPLANETADWITMLAVLEHLDHPQSIANELHRILKPNGQLLLTVPSPMNKPLLDLLSIFHIVRPEMIKQHKNYFTPDQLFTIFTEAGFHNISISLFQLGFNIFMKAEK